MTENHEIQISPQPGRADGESGRGSYLRSYIEERSIPITECGCWWWLGSLNHKGYGACSRKITGTQRANRLSWIAYRGVIPAGMFVLHTCDMPLCVNPSHLWLGTNADNMRDMVEKGRSPKPSWRKFSDDDVRAIRSASESVVVLAQRLGVNRKVLHSIRARRTYRNVSDGVAA